MRTVSACACARVQSNDRTAAAAAEFLSSVRRDVMLRVRRAFGMMVLPGLKKRRFATGLWFLTVWFKYFEDAAESQHGPPGSDGRRSSQAQSWLANVKSSAPAGGCS